MNVHAWCATGGRVLWLLMQLFGFGVVSTLWYRMVC